MAIDRNLWSRSIDVKNLPRWRCEICQKGFLEKDETRTYIETPQYVKAQRNHQDWDPDWEFQHFSFLMRCNRSDCGAFVSLIGHTQWEEWFDGEFDHELSEVFRVFSVFPSLSIFHIPEDVPGRVRREIKRAFSLYWIDESAAAAALRASIERLLDHLGVPKELPNSRGEIKSLTLHRRIEEFGKSRDYKESLHALRVIGNLGAHGSSVEADNVLDAMELLEDALHEILDLRKARVNALRYKLSGLPQT